MVFERLKEAYNLGGEYSKLSHNLFFFGNKMTPDGSEYLFMEVYEWERREEEIKKERLKFGFLERIAFELGDTNFDFFAFPPGSKFEDPSSPFK